MNIVTAYFYRQGKYEKLLNVFLNSAEAVMPGVKIEIVNIKVPLRCYNGDKKHDHHMDTYFAFMAKTRAALAYDEPVCISDNDIMFYKSVSDVWKYDFDIAVTRRNHWALFNTGVFFSKSTPAAKYFIARWLFHTKEIAQKYDIEHINKHAGIDQAALIRTMAENQNVEILELPCNIWNAEQTCWKTITDETKVIHIKSGLRAIVFGEQRLDKKHSYLKPILERIENYDRPRKKSTNDHAGGESTRNGNTRKSNTIYQSAKVRSAKPRQRFYSRY